MIPWQPIQILLNLALAALAGYLAKVGIDSESAAAIVGALGAIIIPIVFAALQRRQLLLTEPPASPEAKLPPPTSEGLSNKNGRGLLLLMLALLPVLTIGCTAARSIDAASIRADDARREAIEPVVQEHISRHPEQEETWAGFMAAWKFSIEARRKLIAGE
jgi:hypothetical protein